MTAMPMPSVPVMSPADFFRLEVVHIVLRDDRGLRAFAPSMLRRNRRQWRRICAGSKCRSARGYAKGEFQKMTAFHDISSLVHERANEESFATSR
jgi:hypothetical protein